MKLPLNLIRTIGQNSGMHDQQVIKIDMLLKKYLKFINLMTAKQIWSSYVKLEGSADVCIFFKFYKN